MTLSRISLLDKPLVRGSSSLIGRVYAHSRAGVHALISHHRKETVRFSCLLIIVGLLSACCNNEAGTGTRDSHQFVPSDQIPLTKQRLLPLNTTMNTRDMGGYSTADGRRVKWGVLFRSDSLANMDDPDLAYLEELQLTTVTDFRSDSEREEAPDRLPQKPLAITYRTLPINDPAVDAAALGRKIFSGKLTQEELVGLLDRSDYIENPEMSLLWGQWVASLAEPGALPHMFHCTAGKDRTGFAAALVLLTLGVPKDQVMQDFLLSNTYLGPKIEESLKKIQAHSEEDVDTDILRQILGVSPNSLNGAIQAMESKYGSIDEYIELGLGIDLATRLKLQAVLLE
ncbi:MAG: tyrosine-protein phosphatase [Pseudomonadales bacterium]